jgi:hypothetical protein
LQSFVDEQQNNSPNNPFGNRMKITWAVFNPFICIFQPRISRIKRIILELFFQISRTKMLAFLKLEKFDKNKI